eukprot:4639305-Pleurochrysis_carterae.AAC.1
MLCDCVCEPRAAAPCRRTRGCRRRAPSPPGRRSRSGRSPRPPPPLAARRARASAARASPPPVPDAAATAAGWRVSETSRRARRCEGDSDGARPRNKTRCLQNYLGYLRRSVSTRNPLGVVEMQGKG